MAYSIGSTPKARGETMVYLDNAATSWPKPEAVYQCVDRVMRPCGGNPGRSGHRLSLAAHVEIEKTRRLLAELFHADDPSRFIFTRNATEAVNLALKGLLFEGDHAIIGSMEHNAIVRPLEALKSRGVSYTMVPVSPVSGVSAAAVEAALTPQTKLIALSHASNVTGTLNPIEEIGQIARKHHVLFLLDAAQTAGLLPIDLKALDIDLLACSSHKGLLGPQGVGILYIGKNASPLPLIEGGTGSKSEQLTQPDTFPDRYESGTLNTPGIAGLGAGIRHLLDTGIDVIAARERMLTQRLLDGLGALPSVTLYGSPTIENRIGIISFNISGYDCAEVAIILDQSFDIAVRAGLHCAPLAHAALGTLSSGTVRASVGAFSTIEHIDSFLQAVCAIAGSISHGNGVKP